MNPLSFVAGREAARWASIRMLVVVALVGASAVGSGLAFAQTTSLNDTGIVICYGPSTPCEPVQHKKQDAMVGRDAAARTPGSGLTTNTGKGFSFTKISHSGGVLPDSAAQGIGANDWACNRDNVTGLTWEIKTNISTNFRYVQNTYSWWQPDSSKNGGNPGVENAGSCSSVGRCDTIKYIADVNATGLCGKTNWRMPMPKEVMNVGDYGAVSAPFFLGSTFPNAPTNTNRESNPVLMLTALTLPYNSGYTLYFNSENGAMGELTKSINRGSIFAVANP